MGVSFDGTYLSSFIDKDEITGMQYEINSAHNILHSDKGVSNGVTGWLDLPVNYDKKEFEEIKICAQKIREDSDALIVIGIGGSYLGARAAIEFLNSPNYNLIDSNSPKMFFAGNNLSPSYILEIINLCKDKDISLNVISKSGTTTETSIAFKILKEFIEKKYGKDKAKTRIYCTTDQDSGFLRKLSDEEGYKTFTVPKDIGGRFSMLSSVGLLPIAVSGANIDDIMSGAAHARDRFMPLKIEENDCYKYAAIRNILYRKGKLVEILTAYEPRLSMLLEWWKQLYGESEGKDHNGIFPSSAVFTTDLHSMGQFIQDGSRIMFETSLIIENEQNDIILKGDTVEGLEFISGKSLSYINKKAFEGTVLAHSDGGVPNSVIKIKDNSCYEFGELIYFFEKSCAMSGLILGINPFNQPGVEAYKKNMFALLGKAGYESLQKSLNDRLKNHFILR